MTRRDFDQETSRRRVQLAAEAERVAVARAEEDGTWPLPVALFGAFAVALLVSTLISG